MTKSASASNEGLLGHFAALVDDANLLAGHGPTLPGVGFHLFGEG